MFSVLAGRRLASGPPAKAGLARVPASRAPRPPNASAHLVSRPSSARRSRAALASAQPRAVPLPVAAPRRDRGRELPPRGDHVPASPAARQPWPGTAPTRPPSSAGVRALAHSRPALPPLLLHSRELRALPSPRSSSAGVQLKHHRTILQFLVPRAPPRLPRSRARTCSAFRAQVGPPRASPPASMAPPCTAAVERPFSFPLQPRIATLSSSLSPRASPALALWRCRGRRRPLAAGRAAPPRQRAPRHGASPRLAKPARQSGRGPKPCQAAALLLFARAAQAESGHGPVPFRRPAQ